MLGKNIREYRIEKGLTQLQLAEQVGATQGAVYFREREINQPTAGYLIKLARVFEISVDELLSFESQSLEEESLKLSELSRCFVKLTAEQQDLLI